MLLPLSFLPQYPKALPRILMVLVAPADLAARSALVVVLVALPVLD